MKKYICLIFLLFVTPLFHGQNIPENFTFVGNVLGDTTDLGNAIFKGILPPIQNSKNTIEIRFLIAPDMKTDTLISLYYDEKWNTKKYILDTNEALMMKHNDSKQELSEIFRQLVENDIFNLPDNSNINIAPTYIDLETGEVQQSFTTVLHATTYIVQFKVGNKYRTYGFNSPEIYAKSHPEIIEFKKYLNILKIIQTIE